MSKKKIAGEAADGSDEFVSSGPPPFKAVKITFYKVRTSQGRFLEGDTAHLPEAEAADLVAAGHAVPAPL